MKEVVIFLIIMVLALAILFTIDEFDFKGANILSAFRYGPTRGISKKTKEPSTTNTNQPIAQNPTPQTPAPQSPAPQPQYPKPTPQKTELPGYATPRKPEALSLYYQKVKISRIIKKSKSHPSVIRLRVSTKEEINLTGFTIQTRHGEFKIPKGVEKYKANRGEKDIIIDEYINIYIIGDLSPLKTDAFRINACFGYLKKYNDFYPSFSNYCLEPRKEDLYHLHPYCQDYILDLRRCEIPNYSKDLRIARNSYCTSYITENLNYAGCYDNFNKKDNFLKNTWYIYSKSDLVEPLYDIIYLYDQNNYLVDDYSY